MSDINIVYSGGVQNTEADNSLGGYPSPISIESEEQNNLFDDVSARETTRGHTDYRCFYVFNDSLDLKYNVDIYYEYLNNIGATIQLGILLQNEVRNLEFTTIPTGGTFTITVQGLKSGTITWDSDPNEVASRIENALKEVTDCTVEVINSGEFYYKITFKGILGNKALSSMSITDNNLTPSGSITPTIQQITIGSPINTIAPDTGFENIVPSGVPFYTVTSPLNIGTLNAAEGFPVWIKRTVSAGFEPVEGDGFIFHTNVTGTF